MIKTVGILGGGAAGYLAALTLYKKIPDISITIVESPSIGTIRVGESTTDHILSLLHNDLELDIPTFMKAVRPVWKLGIRFRWGLPGDYYFDYGAIDSRIFEAHRLAGDANLNLPSMLIEASKSLLAPIEGSPSMLGISNEYREVNYGYQFENGQFIQYLKKQAISWGIHFEISNIVNIEITSDKEKVGFLQTEDGRKLYYDFYIDCSGFRSEIMGKKFGSSYISFQNSIFTDRAIVASVPNNGKIKSCTITNTMESGWQWITPMRAEDHIGYVYSSDFCSDEEALCELKSKNPGMGESRILHFKSGRLKDFWRGNVVAIGNSYGFIEPLHGAALQLIIMQIKNMINNWHLGTEPSKQKDNLNDNLGKQWDYAKEVLALHFKHNKKYKSPFWKMCNEETNLPMMNEYDKFFEEIGPFSSLPFGHQNFLFPPDTCQQVLGNFGIDTIMMSLCGKEPGLLKFDDSTKQKQILLKYGKIWKEYADKAIPMDKALQIMDEEPERIDIESLKMCFKPLDIRHYKGKVLSN